MTPAGGFSDRDLVLAFKAGRSDAYDEMFRRHHERVMGVCSRMLRNPQDAEEAAQETFLKAYQALPRFNGQFQLGAWLARIAANVCVDHLRVKSRSHLVSLPTDDQVREPESGPEDVVVGDFPRLDVAISNVQPLHARALALRAVEGLSHREIAGRLHLSPEQVKALLHRARHSLRRAWETAEGWALVPIMGTRSFFSRSESTQAGSNVASLAPQVPYFVEKVAASAVIVVAALSGLPSSPDTQMSRPAVVAPQTAASAVDAPKDRVVMAGTRSADAGAPEAEALDVDLIGTIEATVDGREKLPDDDDGTQGGNGEGDIGSSANAAAQDAVRKVKDTVHELTKDINRPQ